MTRRQARHQKIAAKARRRRQDARVDKGIDGETWSEIQQYLNRNGESLKDYRIELGTVPPSDIDYWLNNKIRIEGEPEPEMIDDIGESGVIDRPVIIDAGCDYTVEGRHRLAAAKKYKLAVPVVWLSRRDGRSEPVGPYGR